MDIFCLFLEPLQGKMQGVVQGIIIISILWCSYSLIPFWRELPSYIKYRTWNDLARFGYILDMKVEKNQNPSMFLATYWNLSQKSGDLDFFFLSNLVNLGHFFQGKCFEEVNNRCQDQFSV